MKVEIDRGPEVNIEVRVLQSEELLAYCHVRHHPETQELGRRVRRAQPAMTPPRPVVERDRQGIQATSGRHTVDQFLREAQDVEQREIAVDDIQVRR